MLALSKNIQKNVKSGVFILAVFLFGAFCERLIPTASTDLKKSSDESMVEKVGDDSLKLSPETLTNIKVSAVKSGDVPEQLSIMGKISVAEDKTSVIAARISGRISKVFASSGELIKAGQPLLSLFSPDFVIAREEYLQSLNQVRDGNDPEDKNLLALSKQKLESLGVSASDISHLAAQVENPELIIRSPRTGAVIDKKAVVGNLVNPGDPLFTVGDTNSIWFAGDIYPTDLEKMHKGQDVVVESGGSGAPIHGKLSFISPMVDSTTRTIKVRAEMENLGNSLRLDQYVRGNVILSNKTALTIPKESLVREGDGYVCFKEMPNHVFKKVAVVIGGETAGQVVITQGLTAGDHVVSDGALLLISALTTSSETD